ncbi:MAG: class I SAM-dependent methyltransferase [Eubacteriales bacterium]|nr:class I SAM-dependent methyltransferase [Eubacteriales bacterium]
MEANNREAYDLIAEVYGLWQNKHSESERYVELLMDFIDSQDPDFASRSQRRVLDYGAAAGQTSSALARLGYEVHGIDFSPALIAEAEAGARDAGMAIRFHLADFLDLEAMDRICSSWEQGGIDLIAAFLDTFNHLRHEDLLAVLADASNRLDRGAYLLFDLYDDEYFDFFLGQDYVEDFGSRYLVWRNQLSEDGLVNQAEFTLFEKCDGGEVLYRRKSAHLEEFYHSPEALSRELDRLGFDLDLRHSEDEFFEVLQGRDAQPWGDFLAQNYPNRWIFCCRRR